MSRSVAAHVLSVASQVQAEADTLGIGAGVMTPSEMYDTLITDAGLRATTRKLFRDGHHSLAVEEAYKYLNNVIKKRSGLTADGADLMRTAFSPKNPRLKVNELRTQSQQDQQSGYMDIFAGCMTGIRNPRAHEHQYLDRADIAIEMLAWANHLISMAQRAKLVRKGRRSASTR